MSKEMSNIGPFIGPHLAFEPRAGVGYAQTFNALSLGIDQPGRPVDLFTHQITKEYGTPQRLYGVRIADVRREMLVDMLMIYQEATGTHGITLDNYIKYPENLDSQLDRLAEGRSFDDLKFHSKFGNDFNPWFQGHLFSERHRVSSDAKHAENLITFKFWLFKGQEDHPLTLKKVQEIESWEHDVNRKINDYLIQKGIGIPFNQFD